MGKKQNKTKLFSTPSHLHKSRMVVISHSSDSVCTHLCVAIHPHLNRVDSEIAVNTVIRKKKKIKPALKPSKTTVAI